MARIGDDPPRQSLPRGLRRTRSQPLSSAGAEPAAASKALNRAPSGELALSPAEPQPPLPLDGQLSASKDARIARDGRSYRTTELTAWLSDPRNEGRSPQTGERIAPDESTRARARLATLRRGKALGTARAAPRRDEPGSQTRDEIRATMDEHREPPGEAPALAWTRADYWTRSRAPEAGSKPVVPPLDHSERVSEDLIDPISLGRMAHPVVAADAHLYDKAQLAEAYRRNPVSPKTNLPLAHGQVFTHHAAARAVDAALTAEGTRLEAGTSQHEGVVRDRDVARAALAAPALTTLVREGVASPPVDRIGQAREAVAAWEDYGRTVAAPLSGLQTLGLVGLAAGAVGAGGLSYWMWSMDPRDANQHMGRNVLLGFGGVVLGAVGAAAAGVGIGFGIRWGRQRSGERARVPPALEAARGRLAQAEGDRAAGRIDPLHDISRVTLDLAPVGVEAPAGNGPAGPSIAARPSNAAHGVENHAPRRAEPEGIELQEIVIDRG